MRALETSVRITDENGGFIEISKEGDSAYLITKRKLTKEQLVEMYKIIKGD